MDESPYFWEYLPRRIVTPQLSRVCTGWKRGYHNCRSTLVLAIAADGSLLRPAMVIKRSSPYTLRVSNDIDLKIMSSTNGWINADLAVDWLKDILLPYIKGRHCMLLWDTYEAHKSEKVLNFLKDNPNIHVGMIVGGRTSVDQPLDINFNKYFKTICKKESVDFTNKLIDYFNCLIVKLSIFL